MANGYVRYGNSIHLDGFQILDFCIENAISLDSLNDRPLGRKVFFTGNDTNIGYLREHVWDGDRWRAAAYLDDIDKITNGEGSLGTRVKALEDMLGLKDVTNVIDTWNDVQEFFKNVDEGLTLMTMLDGKLDKTGGTIYKDGNFVPLTIKSTGEYAGLGLKIGENGRAVLAYYGGLDWRVTNESYQSEAKILHNFNIGDYAALKDGSNAEGRWENGAEWLETNHATPTTSLNELVSASNAHKMLYYMGWAPSDAPETEDWANALLHINRHNSGGASQLLFNSKGKIFYRATHPSTVSDSEWKAIAFTDSNVASATKLETPRAIWGKSFDGTGNVTGDLYLSPVTNDGNALSARLVFSGYSGMPYGPVIGTATSTITSGYGRKDLVFMQRNETSWATDFNDHTIAMLINPSGNVTIGDSDLAGDTYGLYVGKSLPSYFSNRVLIGGAEDDGETALQVKGDVRLGSVTAIETYISSESNGYLGLLSTGNEMVIEGKTNSDININYRKSKRGYAPKTWNWLAGSSTEYADFVLGHATFAAGAYIPTGQKLTIGDANGDHATIEYDSIAKAIKVDGNLFTTGTLASGGKAKEGTGTGSGSANVRDFELPADGKTTYDCDHLLKSKNVIVQVFEKAIQNNIEVWEMILTDVTIVTEDRVTVTFGRPTTKVHKVHIIGGNVS